ncbi:hypothetical protein DM826_12515 [Halonotius aquaticus]|jgi:hypothetical protein|uniref:Uncharacterized protein n=1 Tax=Halonotius aquaticus TaxID=2216978 RepID=A0A3A6PPT1_9EURY|nr:hypothetical protein [Halonotius aquaticus]RJX42452.1 hypothetical protein DM826_12515 [Halonotius aquaticus]
MNVGWAYLGLAAICVIVGAYMGMIQERLLGDFVMLISLPLIYVGSTSLAAGDVAEKLSENAIGSSTESSKDSDEP